MIEKQVVNNMYQLKVVKNYYLPISSKINSNMIKYSNKKVIEVSAWDKLVKDTYGKPYSFQQQDGCKDRGTESIAVPTEWDDSLMNDSIPEVVNGEEMGVKFAVWLERDPKKPLKDEETEGDVQWRIGMWWERNFYPDVQMIANDLHSKGLIEAGDYTININW